MIKYTKKQVLDILSQLAEDEAKYHLELNGYMYVCESLNPFSGGTNWLVFSDFYSDKSKLLIHLVGFGNVKKWVNENWKKHNLEGKNEDRI